jgi:hypothetical protein
VTAPDAPELVTVKSDRKFITICGNPVDPAPASSAALRRLRGRVVAASAERGFYVSVRGFTAEATHFAETAPVQLIDTANFIRALQRSRKGMTLPQTYKAMCRQCGDIVQHRLTSDEARSCGSGHPVAPRSPTPTLSSLASSQRRFTMRQCPPCVPSLVGKSARTISSSVPA